jgi:two-component system, LuxR family, sensor kinase FixL
VSDTGHGIAAEKLPHVFDPFYTPKPNGVGMGLPISRTIIEAHGGRLWVESNHGAGATFHSRCRPRKKPPRHEHDFPLGLYCR